MADRLFHHSPAADPAPPTYPDPILSANLYCAGRLSEAVSRVVHPFWRDVSARGHAACGYVWVVRYARRGEHLKIRVHGPQSESSAWRDLLQAAAGSYLEEIGPRDPEAPRHARALSTPIDREDGDNADHPDRELLWTTYARSHVSLGYRPYLQDDRYVALLTRCLGRGTEILLKRLAPEARWNHATQQAALLNALIAGLAALPLSPRERSSWLLYHRDGLLRGMLKQSGASGGARRLRETLERFRGQAAGMQGDIERLGRTAETGWAADASWPDDLTAWRQALVDLSAELLPHEGDRAYDIDPFADRVLFLPLFKVFHGFANQLGLTPLNEAFAHHLLLAATADGDLRDRAVRVTPELGEERAA